MSKLNTTAAAVLALGIFAGLAMLGYQLADTALAIKKMDRTVVVKGLAEKEFPADVVIWPISFSVAGNDLTKLYDSLDSQASQIRTFLQQHGISQADVTLSAPAITDKSAQQYNNSRAQFRYTANQTVTVYSHEIAVVRQVMSQLSSLGKQGIVLQGGYQSRPQYLFTRLNEVKPAMIEEATKKARMVAQKFAADSDSTLGKIKRASQGQFTISSRDNNNPQIKKVRVVSTVEYYLAD